MDARSAPAEGEVHGLRSPRLPRLRPASQDPQRDVPRDESEVFRPGVKGRGGGAEAPPRGASGADTVDQCRVLLGGGAAGRRSAQGVLHANLRHRPRRRMERSCARAGGQQPHNPAAIGIHRTGAAEASAPRPEKLIFGGLDARALGNLGAFGLAWFLVIAIALTGWFVVATPLRHDALDNDLTLIYIGIRIALEHGWSHVYSLPLQHDLFVQLRPHATFNDGERFISVPPYAWLILPLTVLGPAGAVYAWLAISLAALGAAWWLAAPGPWPTRALWLLAALAWYPVLYGLSLAQPALVVVLIVVVAWRLAGADKPYLAGRGLGLSVTKP